MPTLQTYQLLDKELPAALTAGLVALAFIVVLTVICVKGCCCENCFQGEKKWIAPLMFNETVKLYFPDVKIEEEKIKVLDYEMNKKCFASMSVLFIPIILGTMFITFWNVYLVEEAVRGGFEDNFDCFPKTGNDYLQQEPVTNRSVFELNSAVSYECYRLVFRYAEGLGAAGGILVFTGVISKLYFALLVTIHRNLDDDDKRFCRVILYGTVCGVAIIIFILFITISVGAPVFRETIFQTTTYQIQFAMYAVSLLVIVVSGVVVAIGIEIENWKKTKPGSGKIIGDGQEKNPKTKGKSAPPKTGTDLEPIVSDGQGKNPEEEGEKDTHT